MKANAEIGPEPGARRRWSWGKRIVLATSLVALVALLCAGGAAYATYDYSGEYAGRILPGSVIGGIDVSGMSAEDALAAVKASIRPKLQRKVAVRWDDRTWRTTPQKLGARSDAAAAVEAAVRASGRATFMDKARMRWLGEDLDFQNRPSITYPRQGVRGFVAGIASSVDTQPVDASMDYSTGWMTFSPDSTGRKVLIDETRAAVSKALRKGPSKVDLPVKVLDPEVTSAAFDQVLLVRIGENKLYLYENGAISRAWSVATGQPEYMTPTGTYTVTEKRYLPTWVNPAPDTWGADLPAEIPPGPGNPLGVRAINWSAPAIRFHGTEATYSLGFNASHGCVRMANEDVIELYDIIDVGTPIVSLQAGSLKPLYVTNAPDPTPVAGDEPTGADDEAGQQDDPADLPANDGEGAGATQGPSSN